MAWMMEQAYPIFLDVVLCVFISLNYFRLSLCGYVYCCFYVIRELSIIIVMMGLYPFGC